MPVLLPAIATAQNDAEKAVALPGLEGRPTTINDLNSGEVSAATPASSRAYVEASSKVTPVDRKEPSIGGSTVANTLSELLKLARELGADEAHPAMAQAVAFLGAHYRV